MRIAVPRERREGERRVAATPETVRKLRALGVEVAVEAGAATAIGIADSAYAEAGAIVARDETATLEGAAVVFKVQRPMTVAEDGPDELALVARSALLIGLLDPFADPALLVAYADAGVTALALELLPRITRAQTMDALSSQSNLAGYRAVLEAAAVFDRALPMMMTAAGTVPPARVFVIGAGVAGLQAIATARRIGAIVSATDVRPAAKEQVESLGARFVGVPATEGSETAGGYAREMDADFGRRQSEVIHETLRKQDIVIATALIPGRRAPVLITEAMVKDMKPGAVIVDLAVEAGGNCALSRPDAVVAAHGVRIVGYRNMASRIGHDASQLYARNLLHFVTPLIGKDGALALDWQDDILRATCLTHAGAIVHPSFARAG